MSLEPAASWSCHRKKAYPDEKIAAKVARKINDGDVAADVVAYACYNCGRYHVGRRLRGT